MGLSQFHWTGVEFVNTGYISWHEAWATLEFDQLCQYPYLFVSPLDCQLLLGLWSFTNGVFPGIAGPATSLSHLHALFVFRCFSPRLGLFTLIIYVLSCSLLFCPSNDRWSVSGHVTQFWGVFCRFVAISSHAEVYFGFSLDMVDYLFHRVFLSWFLLELVRLVFITCPWHFVGGAVALDLVRTRRTRWTDDVHRVFDSVLPNLDTLAAHTYQALQVQPSWYELWISLRGETFSWGG